MALSFHKAQKKQAKLRLGLVGPSGSGKTFSALAIATGLGGRIAVIDSERGSASLYADKFTFDVLELSSFKPEIYVEAIHAAEAAGYDVLIIDSLSHAWAGKDGALQMVDDAAARSRSGNKFAAWREVTPVHNALVDAMLLSRCHVIATMRAKTEWVLEDNDKGQKVPRKIGLQPVQRDGMEYEFTLVGDLDGATFITGKTRCPEVAPQKSVIQRPGIEFGKALRDWLENGSEPDPAVESAVAAGTDLINSKPFAEVKDAIRAHLETIPANVREEVRARLLSAYSTRAAVEHAKEQQPAA